MQDKLNSVIDSKSDIEDIIQNYISSSVMNIFVRRGLRGLENNVSNLRTRMSILDNDVLRLESEIYEIKSSHIPKRNETLGNNMDIEKTGYQTIKFEISPLVRQLENNAYACESIYSQQSVPCKEGWFLYGEKCYKMFLEKKSWMEASRNCTREGGRLATVSSHKLQEFVNIFFILNERITAWIGLNDRNTETVFVWDDGSPVGFTNWDYDQPDGKGFSSNEDCVEIRLGIRPRVNSRELGYWNDLDCNYKMPYICQVDKNKGVKNVSPDPRFCSLNEGGGFKYRQSCFNIVRTKKSWEEAEKHCEENFNGHLVTILDTEVETFLNYILSNINEDFWIGIRGKDKVAQKWISGWPVAHNRLNLDMRQFPIGTCVLKSNDNLWTTAECFLEFPFICETTKIKAPVLKKAPKGWQCPDTSKEWVDLGGESCYIFGTNRFLKWYEANYECGRNGGTLASITSEEEAMILQYFVIHHSPVFIGLHRSLSNRHLFEWADGSSMEYANWGPGEPNSDKEDCVEMYSRYLVLYDVWNDIDCYGHTDRLYICSAKKVPSSTTELTASSTGDCVCPEESSFIKNTLERFPCPHLSAEWQDVEGDYCYIFVTNKSISWDKAHYECGRKGGILASIHSEEQTNVLQQYVKHSAQSIYIGLHRSLSNKNVFEWADGSKVDFHSWRPSEPSDITEECVTLVPESMKWKDINCNSLNGYICAAKKLPSSLTPKPGSTSNDCVCSSIS